MNMRPDDASDRSRLVPLPEHSHRLTLMANVLGAFALVTALLFSAGEGLPRIAGMGPAERAQFVLFVLMLAGLALSWFRTLPGALLTLGAFAGFWAVNFSVTGGARLGSVFALFPMAGALQLAAWWSARRARGAKR